MANTYGKDHEEVQFMVDAFNREVAGLEDVELWIHTCWGNPNMQRVMEDTSYANSIEIYLERCRGDVWTLEMKDRNQKDLELFAPFRNNLKKKICIGAVSHRSLQADRPEEVANEIRQALRYIPAESLIVSSDCGFGRQGSNREIAFYKASAIAQGTNIVRRELGLPVTEVPAANPMLQVDVVPGRGRQASTGG
jgi:5-methyltetrahydropteroyltriglutamate--homocysteine methyltransferase